MPPKRYEKNKQTLRKKKTNKQQQQQQQKQMTSKWISCIYVTENI